MTKIEQLVWGGICTFVSDRKRLEEREDFFYFVEAAIGLTDLDLFEQKCFKENYLQRIENKPLVF